ncbi:MAG: hypothetical protein GF317_02480 [Candidatus Lokiarchaeota archaeon]|nr:hypothetical protein [Candidatus Lokiarchaeota archaeon]MBD3198773.1 hypothetical protein [Candidatus Lokiarchaeota archaeon]
MTNLLINYKTLFRNLIISGIFGLLLPYIALTFLIPSNSVFDLALITTNGIIFILAYTALGMFHKNTFYRFLIGMGYVVLLIYFYSVGNNIFTFFLPHTGFGYLFVSGTVFGIPITVGYNYAWVVVVIIILTGLNILRKFIKPLKEKQEKPGKTE